MKLFNQKCSYFDKRILKCMTVGFWGFFFFGDTVYSVQCTCTKCTLVK